MKEKKILLVLLVALLTLTIGTTVLAQNVKSPKKDINISDNTILINTQSHTVDNNYVSFASSSKTQDVKIETGANEIILAESPVFQKESDIISTSWKDLSEQVPFPLPSIELDMDKKTFSYTKGYTDTSGCLTINFQRENSEVNFTINSYVGSKNWSSSYSFNGEILSNNNYTSKQNYEFEIFEIKDNLLAGEEERKHDFALILFEDYEIKIHFYNIEKEEIYYILDSLDLFMYE